MKDEHNTGRAPQAGPWFMPQGLKLSAYLPNAIKREVPYTRWKETSRKTGCKELTEEALQSGEFEFNAWLYWTSMVNVFQPHFPHL